MKAGRFGIEMGGLVLLALIALWWQRRDPASDFARQQKMPSSLPLATSPIAPQDTTPGSGSPGDPLAATAGGERQPIIGAAPARPAWVRLLLTNGAATIRYLEMAPVGPEVVGELLARYWSLPSIPFTDRAGIARALGFVGDERVVAVFRDTLFQEYRGLRVSEADGDRLCGLVVLMGHLAARYTSAFDFLRPGLEESHWRTNVTWTIARTSPMREVDGDSPVRELVRCTVRALALSGRDDAWQLVLDRKEASDRAYLLSYAGQMVDSAARRRVLLDHGRSYLMTNSGWELFVRWAQTPEGLEWRRWSARLGGLPEP